MASNGANPPPAPANTLDAMLAKKQQLDEDLRSVEKAILEAEESYLEDTNPYGNVVKGWDGFLTSRPKPHGASHHASKRSHIAARDRIFSNCSTTAPIAEFEDGSGMGLDDMDAGGGMAGTLKLERRVSHRPSKADSADMDED